MPKQPITDATREAMRKALNSRREGRSRAVGTESASDGHGSQKGSEGTVIIPRVECVRATKLAILVVIPRTRPLRPLEVWIPQSQIDDDSDVFEVGTKGDLIVARWFALKESLIDE